MFDKDYSYHLPACYKKSTFSDNGQNCSYLYKVKTTKRTPYFIKVDEFEHDLYFLKFYPKRMDGSKEKYKKRLGKINELTRLVSTCVKLAYKLSNDNPDASFGFYGQWDKKDVVNESEISQRYRIYKRAIMSKINKDNYHFIYEDSVNTMIAIPNHLYSDRYKNKIKSLLLSIYSKDLNELRVPTIEEYESYKLKKDLN